MSAQQPELNLSNDYQAIVESIPGIVFIASAAADGAWYYVNEWIEPILGFTVEEWTSNGALWLERIHPEDRERVLAIEARTLAELENAPAGERIDQSDSYAVDYRVLHKDGHIVWIRDSSVLVPNPDGGEPLWHGVLMDISDQKEIEQQLERRSAAQAAAAQLGRHALGGKPIAELLDEACESISGVLGADRVMATQTADGPLSVQIRATYGWDSTPEERGKREFSLRSAPGYTLSTGQPLLLNDWDNETQFEIDPMLAAAGIKSGITVRIEGPSRPWGLIGVFSTRANAFDDHDVNFVTLLANTLADAIERQQTDADMQHRALHDSLTGLPNRVLFTDRLTQALERSRRHTGSKSLSAILFVDVDHFKNVNDTLGHQSGDELLIGVAARLREAVRPADTVARFGGDEFGLLLEEVANERDAIATAERIAAGFARPFALETSSQFVSVSIGIALADGHEDAQAVLSDADAAMYRAKQRGRARYDLFDVELRERALARGRLESDLQLAIEKGELRLEYQPIVLLESEVPYAVEVLLRWEHRQRGLIPPDEFIPIAEESGLIDGIGQWVIREALRDAARWQRLHPELKPLCLGINTSVHQLQNARFPEVLSEIITAAGVDPSIVNLELDERVLREEARHVHRTLEELKSLGARLLIHDFGGGSSSLTQLATLPIDAIKVERSFITALDTDDQPARIARAVIASGLALGLSVVGTGVESAEEVAELRRLGVKAVQGYFYSEPVCADTVGEILGDANRLKRTLP
jgi:diguanylate cyclase (GGDEF)-like protein/PAS domain S-box-containing protein